METLTEDLLRSRLEWVEDRIRNAGGDPDAVRLVAVMKDHPEAYAPAMACGLRDFAENRRHLGGWPEGARDECRLHFIGHIQRRDVKKLAPYVHLWQSVDREEAAVEIARYRPSASVLIEVNISEEPQKHGCHPSELDRLVYSCQTAGLEVRGLMGMGPLGEPERARPGFRLLKRLADLRGLGTVSMGMSADFEIAVEEGSTMLRLGRLLFGPRRSAEPF